MFKRIAILYGLLLPMAMFAQSSYKKATEDQKNEIIAGIKQASAGMKTMACNFTQVKELSFMDEKVTSEGKMWYKQANKIRWEYTKPYTYVFATDGTNIYTNSGNNTVKMPVKSSKLFSEISKVMIGGVSGNGLIDSPDFSTQFNEGDNDYQVVLTPLKKEVKDLFSAIHLYIGKKDYRIHAVDLLEKNGDQTSIRLKNMQINIAVGDEVFIH
ncbi:MAG: outer membrane lipoprotein carrier protein LolA [Tannerella sp.]|jgi:outer membrane lipoprotein-sorting protein|nr:outer membrane lipoprotein carrier protein LolA [Tannerella sp.]